MKPLAFPLLADENIHPDVVDGLRARGKDVRSTVDEQLLGVDDLTILRRAYERGRVVLTHDADFGKLAIQAGEPYIGVVFLRPGHISAAFVLGALSALDESAIDVSPPFVAVVERKHDHVRVRLRAGTSTP